MENQPMSFNAISPQIFLAYLQIINDGKLENNLSQFLAPLIYPMTEDNARKIDRTFHVFSKTPKEFKIAVREIISEYLNKNKKLPENILIRKIDHSEKDPFQKPKIEEFLLSKLQEVSQNKPEKDTKLEKQVERKEHIPTMQKSQKQASILKPSEKKSDMMLFSTPQKPKKEKEPVELKKTQNNSPQNIKKEAPSLKEGLQKNKIFSISSQENKTLSSKEIKPQGTFFKGILSVKNYLKEFGKLLAKEHIFEKTDTKEKKMLYAISSTNIPTTKYSAMISFKIAMQLQEVMQQLSASSENAAPISSKFSVPLSAPFVVPMFKEHKINSYADKEKLKKIKRKEFCEGESEKEREELNYYQEDL